MKRVTSFPRHSVGLLFLRCNLHVYAWFRKIFVDYVSAAAMADVSTSAGRRLHVADIMRSSADT